MDGSGKNTGAVHTFSSPPWGLFKLGLNLECVLRKSPSDTQNSLNNQCSSLSRTANGRPSHLNTPISFIAKLFGRPQLVTGWTVDYLPWQNQFLWLDLLFSPSVPLWVEGPSSYVSSYNRRFTQSRPSHGRNTHTGTDQERLLELNEAFEIWKWGRGWVTPLVVYGMQGKQVERVFYVPCLCPP